MATQERIRKPQTVPTQENHEAERMLNEAEQRQRQEAASKAGKTAVEGMDALLDEIDEVLEAEGINSEQAAYDMVSQYKQRGGQ